MPTPWALPCRREISCRWAASSSRSIFRTHGRTPLVRREKPHPRTRWRCEPPLHKMGVKVFDVSYARSLPPAEVILMRVPAELTRLPVRLHQVSEVKVCCRALPVTPFAEPPLCVLPLFPSWEVQSCCPACSPVAAGSR
jgi:hypothetical protein